MILPLPTDAFTFLLHFSVFVAFGVLSIVGHELGHYFAIKKFGGKPKITFVNGDVTITGFNHLNNKDKMKVYVFGVLSGLVMLYPAFLLLFPALSVGLIAGYLVGCKHDFKQIRGLRK